jgi:threonine synthase
MLNYDAGCRYSYATPGQAPGQLEQVVMLGSSTPGPSVIPVEHRQDVAQTLLRAIADANDHIITGFIGNKYHLRVLIIMIRTLD